MVAVCCHLPSGPPPLVRLSHNNAAHDSPSHRYSTATTMSAQLCEGNGEWGWRGNGREPVAANVVKASISSSASLRH